MQYYYIELSCCLLVTTEFVVSVNWLCMYAVYLLGAMFFKTIHQVFLRWKAMLCDIYFDDTCNKTVTYVDTVHIHSI